MKYDRRFIKGDKMKVQVLSGNYDWKVGLKKTLKNTLIFLMPSLIAYVGNVPQQYAWLAGGLLYAAKNWLENQ